MEELFNILIGLTKKYGPTVSIQAELDHTSHDTAVMEVNVKWKEGGQVRGSQAVFTLDGAGKMGIEEFVKGI